MIGWAAATAHAGRMPRHWHAKPWFLRQALCIHAHESGDWHIYNPPYANGFQFTLGTWMRAGGHPSRWVSATPREQVYRAFVIWRQDGGSWREWPTTRLICGLR